MSTSQHLSNGSRIWIYQADREFSAVEVESIRKQAAEFVSKWTSHSKQVMADFEIRYNRFLILILDESHVAAGGCSIDSSVHFIRALETGFQNPMTDRMKFAFKSGDRVEVVSKNDFEKMLENGSITEDTIVFNNLVTTKGELGTAWEVPLKNSWHKQFFAHKV
jgi:hypothetical protein